MAQYMIFGFTFAFAAAVQPGPLMAYLVSSTLSQGWRRTLLAAFSPVLSDGPIIVLVLLILSRVPARLINVLQILGGLFLIYLAVRAFLAFRSCKSGMTVGEGSGGRTLMQAALVNLLNPGPYLGWSLVLGPLLLKGWRETPLNGIVLLVSFYATMVLCLLGTIMLTAAAGSIGRNLGRSLTLVSALALLCFGLYQIWSGIKVLG